MYNVYYWKYYIILYHIRLYYIGSIHKLGHYLARFRLSPRCQGRTPSPHQLTRSESSICSNLEPWNPAKTWISLGIGTIMVNHGVLKCISWLLVVDDVIY